MNDSPASPKPSPRLDWIANLKLECDGRQAVGVSTDKDRITVDIAGRLGLLALARLPVKQYIEGASPAALERLSSLLPRRFDLRLSGVPIGHYEPAAPRNWLAGSIGLPFGCLTIDKIALVRASFSGSHVSGGSPAD